MTLPILPIFRSRFSQGLSLLSLDEPGKAKPSGAVSVFDLAKEGGLKDVVICDDRPDGIIPAYKAAPKAGVNLMFGVRFIVTANVEDKAMESRRTESRVAVFIKGGPLNDKVVSQGYSDLLRLWSAAWGPKGHIRYMLAGDEHSYGRLDWTLLNQLWTENLVLALPYTGSFIGRNTTTFNQITPTLPDCPVWVFKEVDSQLVTAALIDRAIDRYAAQNPRAMVMSTKSIYYAKRSDMRAYITLRASQVGGTWEDPKVRGLSSDSFCWESYKELASAA